MNTIYIGTRLTHDEMDTLLDRKVLRLNQSLAQTCRKVAMDKGIKQTEQGQRLEFYSVTSNEFAQLTNESFSFMSKLAGKPVIRPLIAMDEEKMLTSLRAVNSKSEYRGGMKHSVHCQYLLDLRSAISGSVTKIGDDVGYVKKTRPTYTHNYEIGDWIEVWGSYGSFEGNAKIIKTTAKTYTYKFAHINGHRFHNFESAKIRFNNVTGWGDSSHQEWDFTIPMTGNECNFTFDGEKETKRAGQRNPTQVDPCYRSKHSYH